MKKGGYRVLALAIAFLFQAPSAALKSVLHYYRCSFVGFGCGEPAYDTLPFQQMAEEYGFKVKHSRDSSDLIDVAKYDLVVFDNAGDAGGAPYHSGPGAPFEAFREYMESGGKFLALHGASDHRSFWNWFDTVLFSGALFSGFISGSTTFYRDTSTSIPSDPALERMWKFAEDSLRIVTASITFTTAVPHFNIDVAGLPGVRVLQEVRGHAARNGIRETSSWITTLPGGGRMLYCGLGHAGYAGGDFAPNQGWLKKATYAYMRYLVGDFDVPPVAVVPQVRALGSRLEVGTAVPGSVRVTDLRGRLVASGTGPSTERFNLKPGVYVVSARTAKEASSKTVVLP